MYASCIYTRRWGMLIILFLCFIDSELTIYHAIDLGMLAILSLELFKLGGQLLVNSLIK